MTPSVSSPEWIIDRYEVFEPIASGGMATVHYGRLVGPVGFSRVVAIKRLHPHLARDPEFVAMFIDEARMAAKIRHPNVVPMLDVVATDEHLLLVMEYVQGETLARLIRMARARGELIPPPIAASILVGALYGLHAAHEAKSDKGEPLGLVHRDVSPQNIVVGTDGIARVLDFGIAKAAGRLHHTREGRLKGKLAYMAPEHIRGETVTRAADIYAAAVVFWEALTGERLFEADNDADLLEQVLSGEVATVIQGRKLDADDFETLPTALNDVVLRGLAADPAERYSTAHEMARDIERKTRVASAGEVSEWVERIAGDGLVVQARKVAELASKTDVGNASSVPITIRQPQSGELASKSPKSTPPSSSPRSSQPPAPAAATPESTADAPSRAPDAKSAAGARRRWVVPVVAAAVAASAFFAWRYHGPKAVAAAPAPPVASASAASSADPEDEAQTVEIDKSQSANGSTAAQPNRKHARTPPRSGIVREFPGSKSQCTPPYVIDAQGVKHYKVECL